MLFQLAKPIQDLIPFENRNTIVLYTDGTCESLELAIDTRKEERSDLSICHKSLIIDDATEILTPSYFKTPDDKLYLTFFTKETEKNVVYLVRVRIEPESLQIMDAVTKIRLAREDQDTELKGYAVVDGVLGANLITICECFMQEYYSDNLMLMNMFLFQGAIVGYSTCRCPMTATWCRMRPASFPQ